MNVGSLFTGIGGIDLGLERAGMTVAWQAEIDPYCCRVLAKHWPDVPNLGDVTTTDWDGAPRVDLLCGGYPCQPFSLAGTRAGTGDPRHLWPHMRDAIRHLGPRWVLLENVPGHLSLGFDRVLADLAELGFDAEWGLVSAASVGAPHLRERLFVVAHAHSEGEPGSPLDAWARPGFLVPDTDDAGPQGLRDEHGLRADRQEAQAGRRGWWSVEPDVGRVAHGVPHRVDRLRALGNAVVPQVAEHIGRLIMQTTQVSA